MLRKMYGIEMEVPAGKLPGFYAQVVHKIGDQVQIFDRDKQLFIIQNEEEQKKLADILNKHQMCGEEFTLWLLPAGTRMRLLEDYGFTSISDQSYIYDYLVARFQFNATVGAADERAAALAQMKQHILAAVPEGQTITYIIDLQHKELMNKIASLFHSSLVWL